MALNGEDDNEMGTTAVKKLARNSGFLHPRARACDRRRLHYANRRRILYPGRGTVVTGRVERGIINTGEEVEIVGIKETTTTTCTGVEMFRKMLDEGRAGENVGVLLRGTKRDEVERGQVLAKPWFYHSSHQVHF